MSARHDFAADRARSRPPFRPRRISCPGCGAAQSVADENAQLLTCSYCGKHLELSPSEAKVLGGGNTHQWSFPIEIGESFRHKGVRYEVIGRIVTLEDGDATEVTRHYLLFNPYRGSMWLAEYGGNYDLSEATHVMPRQAPLTAAKGDDLETHDGRSWVAVETTASRIAYVDGALPWVAKVGDWIHAAELIAADGSGEMYEAEATGTEVEYGVGRRVPIAAVRSALGRRDLPDPIVPLEDVIGRRSTFRAILAIAAVALLVNLVVLAVAWSSGHTVLRQSFSAAELTGEALSDPFEVATGNEVLRIELAARQLSNAWMAVDLAVVQGDDAVIHVDDADIEYYHGREGGESWSEGSRSTSRLVRVPEPGTYHLLLHAVSAHGETPRASAAQHGASVEVIAGARRRVVATVMSILCAAVLLVTGLSYHSWKQGGVDDDD